MKKSALFITLAVAILAIFGKTAFAGENQYHHIVFAEKQAYIPHDVIGAKVDLPYLVGLKQVSKNLYLGVEFGKDIVYDAFYPDQVGYYEDDKGYFGYVKITYNRCLFNCPNRQD